LLALVERADIALLFEIATALSATAPEYYVDLVAHLAARPDLPPTARERIIAKEGRMSTLERLLMLKQVSLFAQVPAEVLAPLAAEATRAEFAAAETIFSEGDPGDALYVIVEGEVRVHAGGVDLAHLKRGDCFGEMAILDGAPRSASVTAVTRLETLKITQEDFFEFLNDSPEAAHGVFSVLTRRLREADARIRELKTGANQPERFA
jgi:signal-transduction protein with cAMP-binding, CBS, and nucleotidyltransferase domain